MTPATRRPGSCRHPRSRGAAGGSSPVDAALAARERVHARATHDDGVWEPSRRLQERVRSEASAAGRYPGEEGGRGRSRRCGGRVRE